MHKFEATTFLVESGVHLFVSNDVLFSIVQGSQLDYRHSCVAYHQSVRSIEMMKRLSGGSCIYLRVVKS